MNNITHSIQSTQEFIEYSGLTSTSAYLVFLAIGEANELSRVEIAERLSMTKDSVARLLDAINTKSFRNLIEHDSSTGTHRYRLSALGAVMIDKILRHDDDEAA
tara:strand:- start:591 stop:902 length:312 start_codon:yes stop_codon:yes gene_type:complete